MDWLKNYFEIITNNLKTYFEFYVYLYMFCFLILYILTLFYLINVKVTGETDNYKYATNPLVYWTTELIYLSMRFARINIDCYIIYFIHVLWSIYFFNLFRVNIDIVLAVKHYLIIVCDFLDSFCTLYENESIYAIQVRYYFVFSFMIYIPKPLSPKKEYFIIIFWNWLLNFSSANNLKRFFLLCFLLIIIFIFFYSNLSYLYNCFILFYPPFNYFHVFFFKK